MICKTVLTKSYSIYMKNWNFVCCCVGFLPVLIADKVHGTICISDDADDIRNAHFNAEINNCTNCNFELGRISQVNISYL